MTSILIIGINPAWFAEAAEKGYNTSQSRTSNEVDTSVKKLEHDLRQFQNTAIETVQVRPGEQADWERVVVALKSRPWNGISFGGGLRRHPDLGDYFTELINLAMRQHPGATFLFPLVPTDVCPAIRKYIPSAT